MIALPANYVGFAKHVWEYSPEVFWLNLGTCKIFWSASYSNIAYTLLIIEFWNSAFIYVFLPDSEKMEIAKYQSRLF